MGGTVNKHNNNASQSTGEGQATPQGGSQGGQGGQAAAPSSSSHSVAASASASASVDPGANSGNGGGGPLAPSISKAILLGAPAPTSL